MANDTTSGLSESLQDNDRAARRTAEEFLRFDDAIVDCAEHYEDWIF